MVNLNRCSCNEIPEVGKDGLDRFVILCVGCLKRTKPCDSLEEAVDEWNKGKEMRSYLDIIIDLQDGKKVDYEEARLAALAGNYMLQGAERNIVDLVDYASANQKKDFKSVGAILSYESRFKSRKIPVDKYLGSFHPDYPGRQKERQFHNAIFDKFVKEG